MKLEFKLKIALGSGNKTKIEGVFNEIYDEYYRLVYFCASSYLNKKEDVEDVVEDTFLSFFNHLDVINVSGSIKQYLAKTSKNKAINLSKKNREVLVENIEDFPNQNVGDINFDLMNVIKRTLDENERDILISHVLEGKSLREYAFSHHSNSNTIKSKYHRAIEKLRKVLEEEYEK